MDLLKKLTEFDAPSGKEKVLHSFIKNEAEKMGYEVTMDGLGSVIAHKKGEGKKLMLAHIPMRLVLLQITLTRTDLYISADSDICIRKSFTNAVCVLKTEHWEL